MMFLKRTDFSNVPLQSRTATTRPHDRHPMIRCRCESIAASDADDDMGPLEAEASKILQQSRLPKLGLRIAFFGMSRKMARAFGLLVKSNPSFGIDGGQQRGCGRKFIPNDGVGSASSEMVAARDFNLNVSVFL